MTFDLDLYFQGRLAFELENCVHSVASTVLDGLTLFFDIHGLEHNLFGVPFLIH